MCIETVDIRGVVLTTDRLILRPFEKSDLYDFNSYAKVEGVGECAGWKHHESLEESKQILDHFISGHHTFAVVDRASGKVIGSLGIERSDEAYGEVFKDKKVNELGYVLSKDFWGKGLMTEAARAVIAFMFEKLNLDAVTCGHFIGNDRSRRVIEKCGFKYFGEAEYTTRMGDVVKSKYYVLTRGEYYKV